MKELLFLFIVLSLMCLTSCQGVSEFFQGMSMAGAVVTTIAGLVVYTAVKFISGGE